MTSVGTFEWSLKLATWLTKTTHFYNKLEVTSKGLMQALHWVNDTEEFLRNAESDIQKIVSRLNEKLDVDDTTNYTTSYDINHMKQSKQVKSWIKKLENLL